MIIINQDLSFPHHSFSLLLPHKKVKRVIELEYEEGRNKEEKANEEKQRAERGDVIPWSVMPMLACSNHTMLPKSN